MSVDEEVSPVSLEETKQTASNSLETVAVSNTSLNHSNIRKIYYFIWSCSLNNISFSQMNIF